ncbi:cilia- and flagella-associated protein 47 [Tympanuchus pallidicinctus]|uniref:cilia- and flagella-associated protein 47 n=1 Tax=Tympanuchus pallidicinctus TaxID=109042 RepID=UPI002286D1E2|nr:cilia- and flagella-associated protein 47 [Tympanuchus pallidicinctus]
MQSKSSASVAKRPFPGSSYCRLGEAIAAMSDGWRDVAGVRIVPPKLRFPAAVPGRRYRAALSIQNLRAQSCRLRLLPPLRPQFKLIVENPENLVAPGLQVKAFVEYCPEIEEDLQDSLPLLIEEDIVDIPLVGLIPSCYLETESEVDFGTVVANSKIISKEISIANHGSLSGTFKISYTGDILLDIEPTSGVVEPKSFKVVKVHICTDVPRIIKEIIKVEMEGRSSTEVWIKAVVVEQVLKVLGLPSGNVLECINFGSVYFGSSKTKQISLHNDSPECMDWVAVLEDNAVGGEMGTDLQKSADAVLQDLSLINKTRDLDVSTLIWCIPDQGTLPPYKKSVVTLCFCPKKFKAAFVASDSPPKQDYILFLRFEAAGNKDLQTPSDGTTPKNRPNSTELAVTGSALPVMLTLNRGPVIKFMDCFPGEQTQVLCTLKNESESLPVKFSFRKTAHFNISPEKGKIKKSSTKDLIFSFSPHQIGIFEVKQVIDIIGRELEKNNLQRSKTKSIHQIYLSFIGVCKSKPKAILFRINPGITPVITNATGRFVADDMRQCTDIAPMAILKSTKTQIHTHQINRNCKGDALIAFPNDRSTSIRPSERNKKYRTIFTKTERYNYVDPEFSYSDCELLFKEVHKEYYADFISSLRQHRLQKGATRKFYIYNNSMSIDCRPAGEIMSPKISVTDFPKEKLQLRKLSSDENCLLTSQKLAASASVKEISSGLNSVPSSTQEKDDCNLTLTPKQLHQILVGPSTMNFGDVCVHSTTVRKLHIINNLLVHIWIQIEIEIDELEILGPLCQVVPPLTKTFIPVEFEAKFCGMFKKSFTYTINKKHPGHVLVIANVVPVELHLSARELILNPIPGYLEETEFRTTVRVCNPGNCSAEFTWIPITTQKGTAFSIQPTKGFVEPFSDLECEVVWHPGFNSAEAGEFALCVHKGNTTNLKCLAKFGPTKVRFMEQWVPFSHCALALPTCKTAVLCNIGYNHAYFQVIDSNPLPGMVITPFEGVVPVGGCADLKISFTPNAKMNFDTRVEVAIRNSGVLMLRISGFVDTPEIKIDVEQFDFGGVYVGSTKSIPFLLQNEGQAPTKVLFDFLKYKDFKLDSNKDDKTEVDSGSSKTHLHSVTLQGKSSLQCSLSFTPKEVAAYNFILPVNTRWYDLPLLQQHSASATSVGSVKHVIAPQPRRATVAIPICRVKAVVLQSPLEFSSTELIFTRHSSGTRSNIPDESLDSQKLDLKNISKQQLTWKLNCDDAGKSVEGGVFKFSQQMGFLDPGQKISIDVFFCSSCPGTYTSEMSVCVNDNPSHYKVTLSGTVKSSKIHFDPPFLMLMPVPLDVKTETTIKIIPQDYLRKTRIQVELPELELEDGDRISPFSIQFPEGQDIVLSSDGTNMELICHISFKSSTPVSFLGNIFFIDKDENRFSLQVAATAENCLLTVHSYLALRCSEQQISLISNEDRSSGEVVLHPFYSPQSLSCSRSSSSSGPTAEAHDSWSDITLERDESAEKMTEETEADSQSDGRENESELSFFPNENKEDFIFQKTLTAVQSWFTLFGWSKGPNPVSIPHSLRRDVCKVKMTSSQEKVFKQNLDRDTIYDMLFHLSGQLLPGITLSQSLPLDPVERMIQLYWQHSTLLTFLKSQGASLPHVMPEYLLEPDDYKKWTKMQAVLEAHAANWKKGDKKNLVMFSSKQVLILEDSVFEMISKQAWTDVLLQVYKVFVLPRVSSCNTADMINLENMQNVPRINTELLSSNIYSPYERIILTWLNKNYENNRKTVWKDAQKGKVPLMRWIVNFDRDLLDGLVLAAQIAAYCPFLIASHFVRMYTYPRTPAHFLHNCLILVNAMHAVSLTIDVKATDICDPNPIMMLILCVYLFENLPHYLPTKTIGFTGALHATIVKQIRLKNPSIKTLAYTATLVGRDADDFSLPEGNTVIITPKSQATINVEFTSRFLHPAEAVLLLISKRMGGIGGATLTFSLKSEVKHIEPAVILKCKSPCYELKKVVLNVTNPFRTDGIFRVIFLESTSYLSQPEQVHQARQLKQEQTFSSENNVLNCKNRTLLEEPNEAKYFNCSVQSSLLPEFFSPQEKLFLAGRSSAALEILFLPFNLEKRYCTVILVNEMIGEFVYLVEGAGDIPLPSELLPMDSPNVLHVSSTLEGPSAVEPILYLKCRVGQTLEEKLRIPLVNESRERALAIAAQQQMSTIEYKRRKITGTLDSSSVRAATALLGLSRIERYELLKPREFPPELKYVDYSIQVSMQEFFVVPEKLSIPVLASSRVNLKDPSEKVVLPEKIGRTDAVELPIKFIPPGPGCYHCQILLKSSWDIRVYVIKCVVNTDDVEAEIEFLTPAYQAVIQNIPIRNISSQDWKLEAVLEGQGFSGPPSISVGLGEIALYPLMFKPIAECLTTGRLILQNTTGGIESIFNLKGTGKKPLAQDHIVIDCQVRQVTQQLLWVPNYTKSRLTYKVSSDLSMVSGASVLTVDPDDIVPYSLSISPWRRGVFQGIISFVAEDEDQQQSQHNSSLERTDSELAFKKWSTKTPQTTGAANAGGSSSNCKVWFSLKINSIPAAPERKIDVKCRALDTVGIHIPVTNPADEVLELNVVLESQSLSGQKTFTLLPKQLHFYQVEFSPAVVGTSHESVIFQSDVVGEFWYALKLTVEKPLPTDLPEIVCELGKWVHLYIPLFNPTHETLKLEIANSNPSNFSTETDPKHPIIVAPHSTTEVPVQFCPSALGSGNHKASITFKCSQIKEWIFYLSGIGLPPQLMEPTTISAYIGQGSSVIITFKNPTSENVLVDVMLKDQEQCSCYLNASVLSESTSKESAFHLLLKNTRGNRLAPKEKLGIPVLFMPDTMIMYETVMVIHVMRENGENWPYEDSAELNKDLKSVTISEDGGIQGILWTYPIRGIPEAPHQKLVPAVVRCQARERVEKKVEVLLTGVVPGANTTRNSEKVNGNKPSNIQEVGQDTDGFSAAVEFQYELQYQSNEIKSQLEPLVGMHLIQRKQDTESGIITLIFNIVFAPNKPMRNEGTLVVQCTARGVWKFPLLFIATEPEVDDVINIEAIGLNKESVVDFKLTSQTRYPESFTAYFLAGSDPDFVVLPQAGELLPVGTVGTHITVGFKPRMYGKKHKAILVIQTQSMQWTYEINGLLPQTAPPTSPAKVVSTNSYIRSATVRQRNFLHENLKLTTTGVSSPIKGAPLILRKK